MSYTIDAIRPLVTEAKPTGRYLLCTFTCPVSGKKVQARWQAPQAGSGVASHVASQAKSTLWYEARRQVHGLVRGIFGGGMMGRLAGNAASTALMSAQGSAQQRVPNTANMSSDEIDVGIVEAFQSVSGQFAYVNGQWVHGSAAGELQAPLDRQLTEHAVETRYDKLLTARMMVQLAAAEGGINDDEQLHLGEVLDPELGSISSLVERPPLTGAELGEASEGGVRVSMLAAAWAMALVDEHAAQEEQALLAEFASGLRLSETQATEARELAQSAVLDAALESVFAHGGHDTVAREQLLSLGQRIGMSREAVEIAEARFQKRRA